MYYLLGLLVFVEYVLLVQLGDVHFTVCHLFYWKLLQCCMTSVCSYIDGLGWVGLCWVECRCKPEWAASQKDMNVSANFLATFSVLNLRQLHLCGPLHLALSRCDPSFTPTRAFTSIWGSFTPWWAHFIPWDPPVGGYGGGLRRLWLGCENGPVSMSANSTSAELHSKANVKLTSVKQYSSISSMMTSSWRHHRHPPLHHVLGRVTVVFSPAMHTVIGINATRSPCAVTCSWHLGEFFEMGSPIGLSEKEFFGLNVD